jgi:hypothetical protein
VGHAPARSAHQESLLDEEGSMTVFERAALLAHGGGEALDAHRAAIELFHDGGEQLAIQRVEPLRVDLEQIERRARHGLVDAAVGLDLGKVAHPAQQGDSRYAACRASAARSCRQPPASMGTPRMPAERVTIFSSSAVE